MTPEQQAVIDNATPEQIFDSAVRVGIWIFGNMHRGPKPADEDFIRCSVYDNEVHGSAVAEIRLRRMREQQSRRRR